MLLTRLGFNSTMVVNGDPEQSDLPNGKSGFKPMLDKLRAIQAETEGLAVVSLHAEDIVRHPLVAALLKHI
jgi:phosphate starvation-inducible PhoH-like protein